MDSVLGDHPSPELEGVVEKEDDWIHLPFPDIPLEKVGSEKECQEDIPRKTSHPSTTTPEHQEEIGEGQDDIPDSSMAAGILRQEDGLARDDPWPTTWDG